ncbi:MAG: hypothetical protein ACTHKQ_09300 [Mesorhizobium sp.]
MGIRTSVVGALIGGAALVVYGNYPSVAATRQDTFANAGPVTIWHSSDDAERNSDLPIVGPNRCNEYKIVYSVRLPPLRVGDLIEAHADFEVTDPYSYVAMFGHFIVLGNSPDDVSGVRIGPAATRNMISGIHHDDYDQSASYVIKKAQKNKYVNVVAYSASMLAPDEKQVAKIEQGYGMLSVDVIRGAAISNEIISNPKPALKKSKMNRQVCRVADAAILSTR